MPEDLYADAAPAAAAPAPALAEEPTEDTASDSQTAELPKSALGGKEFKPGDEVVLEVTQVLEDSVIVRYASESGEEETEAPPAEAPPAPAMGGGGMASLME